MALGVDGAAVAVVDGGGEVLGLALVDDVRGGDGHITIFVRSGDPLVKNVTIVMRGFNIVFGNGRCPINHRAVQRRIVWC